MRKLTLLVLAFALALYAAAYTAGAILWRGLGLMILAAAVYAWAAGALPPLRASGVERTWPMAGRVLVALGVLLAGLSAIFDSGGPWDLGAWAWVLAFAGMAAGVWWPGEREGYEPPAYRWTTDAAGRWVRTVLTGDASDREPDAVGPLGNLWLLLIMLAAFILAAALRLWRLGDLPAYCVAAECEAALRLVQSPPALTSLYDLLAHALYRITGDGLYSLRLAGALIGVATLPVFYWAARPLQRAGGAALVAMLLAFSPWHIWASRSAEPWIVAPLWISLAAGVGMRAFASVDRRWWWAAGLAAGLLLLDGGIASGASVLWVLVTLALAVWSLTLAQTSSTTRAYCLATWLAAATVVALPAWSLTGLVPGSTGSVAAGGGGLRDLLGSLLHSGGAPVDYFLDAPLLAALPAALAILGLGQLVRSLHRPHVALIFAGLLAYALPFVRGSAAPAGVAGQALTLLPFVYLSAVVSLDTLVYAFYRTWRALVPMRYALGSALAIVLVAALWRLPGFVRALDSAGTVAVRSVDEAMGRHIAACFAANTYSACVQGEAVDGDPAEYRPVIYAPAAAFDHPATRLLLGANADSDRLRVLDIARDVPPSPMPEGPALYLTPTEDQPSVNLLQEFYPNAEVLTLPRDAGPSQFVAVAVNREDLLERQGLQGFYFEGQEYGPLETASLSRRDGPLAFDWSDDAPLPGAFSALWEGSLQVPASGSYRFSVELPAATGDTPSAFTLQLDDRLILDTSLGLLEKDELLAQGFYRLAMRFRTGENPEEPPPDWAVRWQLPGAESADSAPQVIPRSALYSPALPDVGLIGTYTGGDSLQGPVLTTRKDLVLGAEADLPAPYSVRWEGKLAAPRAGEYLFALNSNGAVQMFVNGQQVVSSAPEGTDSDLPTVYAQSSVYLARGWHDVEIRYAPAQQQPELRILWQAPGSAPSLLPARYLRPELGQLFPGDVALPPGPELLDPSLGNGDFALSYSSELIAPQTVIPPSDLPPLLVEEVWYTGGSCGSGAGQLSAPRGVAVDAVAQRVYIADTGNRRVVVHDLKSGEFLSTFTHPEFEEPVDLALGPEGDLLVLDAVAHPLFRIDTMTGEVARAPADAAFYRPRGVDVDVFGNILVADTGGARVVLLDPQGQVLAQFGGPGTALGAGQPVDALAHGDAMWAVTAEDGRLWRLGDEAALTAMPRANTLDGPHLAGLPGRGFFLTDPVGRSVRYHAASGQPLLDFAYAEAFITPVGVGVDEADDAFYLAVSDSAVCAVSLWRGTPARLQP